MEDGLDIVLPSVSRLLHEPLFHDVEFLCNDGVVVSTNRAFICASNEYFHKMLLSGFSESFTKDRISLQTSSAALKCILHYLFTGKLPAEQQGGDCCWASLMETACLAQQYMVPRIVAFIAALVETQLSTKDFGLVLSRALQADLQPVVRNLWIAAHRLLPQPLAFDESYSADAIRFCLQHTAWLSSKGPIATATTGTATTANGTSTASSSANAGNSDISRVAAGSCIEQETACFAAVLAWIRAQVNGCTDCQSSRHCLSSCHMLSGIDTGVNSRDNNNNNNSSSSSMVAAMHSKPPVNKLRHRSVAASDSCSSLLHQHTHRQQQQQQQCPRGSGLSRSSSTSTSVSDDTALEPSLACGRDQLCGCSNNGNSSERSGSSSMDDSSSSLLSPADSAEPLDAAAQDTAHNSLEDSYRVPAVSNSSSSSDDSCLVGECCGRHQSMLLQLLAQLNWHLLGPAAMGQLEDLALLGTTSLLGLYRAQQRASHVALQGSFASITVGGERGLRCFSWAGEQVLECDSSSHVTASAAVSFTSGRHCWQLVAQQSCDLTWVGLSTGNLQPDCWGGKQEGGWFYGSNDALCHHKNSDKHAYSNQCGFGAWREQGAVVDVLLDMESREVWFSVDGAEPRLGFSGLPDRVYPAVSLRAPARLLLRFRQGCLAAPGQE